VERLAIIVLLMSPISCAHRAGEKATEGALAEVNRRAEEAAPGERPLEAAAGLAVEGALRHLSEPEQVAALERVVGAAAGEAADQVTERMVQALLRELGSDGRGDLGRSIAATASYAATTAAVNTADGVLRRVLPDCGADPECLDRRVEELSRRAGAGLMAGIKEPLGGLPTVLTFVAGLILGILLVTLPGLILRRWRRPRPTPIPPVDTRPVPALQ
jgi:hypothetical protein